MSHFLHLVVSAYRQRQRGKPEPPIVIMAFMLIAELAVNGTFKIPPGDRNYRVGASFEIRKEVILAWIHPHMHARGKDFEYRIVFPGGETRTILRVPQYNWHWQVWCNLDEPIVLHPGARIECTAAF